MNPPGARFRPPAWASALTALAVGLFSALGAWQLHRAEEKRAFFAAFDAPAGASTLTRLVADSQAPALPFAHMKLHGAYDAAHQILLDARVHAGRNGYEVLTPLRTTEGTVLVNRGWIAAPPKRSELPDVNVSNTQREVTGRLLRLPVPGWRPSTDGAGRPGDAAGAPWPRLLLYPAAAEISRTLGYGVHDYQLLLASGEPAGYVRDWRPAVMRPEQHLAYAFQWFALALTAIIVFVVVNLAGTGRS